MADLSATASDTYVGGNFYMMWWNAGDSAMICGYVTADHASEDMELIICPTGGTPNGVVALQASVDIDTLLTDGVMYEFYSLHAGTVLRNKIEATATAALKGQAFIASADGTAGCVELASTAGLVVGYSMKSYDTDAQGTWIELIT